MRVCRRCGGTGNVRWRVCEECRTHVPVDFRPPIEWRAEADEQPEHRSEHDQPWVPRSAFTARTRRSPRD